MNVQTPALKKGKEVVNRCIQQCLPLNHVTPGVGCRYLSSGQHVSNASKAERAREHVKDLSDKHKVQKQVRALEKDFFVSILHASTTKREAKSYIQRFDPANDDIKPPRSQMQHENATRAVDINGVNLGGFYGPAAVRGSPKFVQQPHKSTREGKNAQMHVAIVRLRAPEDVDDTTLNGIGRTISQLERLGLISIVVVDCKDTTMSGQDDVVSREFLQKQAERIIVAIEASGATQARIVDNVVGIDQSNSQPGRKSYKAQINFRHMLLHPLRIGIIPIIPSLGYTELQKITKVPANDIIEALTRELSNLNAAQPLDHDSIKFHEGREDLREEVSLEKLIILDPLGGIPCSKRDNGYHVFLNMEHEFESAKQNLRECSNGKRDAVKAHVSGGSTITSLGASDTTTSSAGRELESSSLSKAVRNSDLTSGFDTDTYHHLQNLELARSFLAMLPRSSSVLITSPKEAANLEKDVPFQAAGVGTRRQRNPLIHNLLTDRPTFSSSLPVGRLGGQFAVNSGDTSASLAIPTTIAKHGMSVTIFPDPENGPWQPPSSQQPRLSLTDPQIDLARLVHLIEDSFGRKLDVSEYLKRVNSRIAGIIIAGEYEGGALLTWEMPPGVVDDGSPQSRARMVPYLDKFAVLKKMQGSATADLVFKTMVRDCFPNGVCWRSRKDNVVNKWYFERSRGTWKLPDTGWTMFWTTPDLSMDNQTFLDYQSVCRSIQPSWADGKAILD